MRLLAAFIVAGATLPATVALAQTPTELLGGSVKEVSTINTTVPSSGVVWCRTVAAASIFNIRGQKVKMMSFGDVEYSQGSISEAPPTFYRLFGYARLSFTDNTQGQILFPLRQEYPATINSPNFTNYVETYTSAAQTLTVTYNINFPNCILPVFAIYRQ